MLYFSYEKKQKPAENLRASYFEQRSEYDTASTARVYQTWTGFPRPSMTKSGNFMGTYYVPPLGRTGRSVCPYFAFLPAFLRVFSASFFGRGAPLFSVPVSLRSWQGRAAFLGSRLLVETHRFYTICRKNLFLDEKVH